jgi:hypothetical protein
MLYSDIRKMFCGVTTRTALAFVKVAGSFSIRYSEPTGSEIWCFVSVVCA